MNAEFVYEHAPALRLTGRDDLRAGVTASEYTPVFQGRKPYSVLFIGTFRHAPNMDALYWLINHGLPRILAAEPRTSHDAAVRARGVCVSDFVGLGHSREADGVLRLRNSGGEHAHRRRRPL